MPIVILGMVAIQAGTMFMLYKFADMAQSRMMAKHQNLDNIVREMDSRLFAVEEKSEDLREDVDDIELGLDFSEDEEE